MKKIIFKHSRDFYGNDVYEEEVEFDDDVTEQEINEEYVTWILERVGDHFTWYEKKEE